MVLGKKAKKTNPKPEAKKTTKTILHPKSMVIVTYCDPPKPSNHKPTITRNLQISRQVGTLSFSGLARHVRGLGASGIHHSSPRIGHDPLVEDQLFVRFNGSPVWGISWAALSGGATKPWRSLGIPGASCESPRFIRRANQVQGPKMARILGGDE